MGAGGKRIISTISISGANNSDNLDITLERINQIILTSNQSGQTFEFSLVNEQGDTVYGPNDIAVPENTIRPNLIPRGKLTVNIDNPVPETGTVTAVIITEGK